MNKDYHLNSLKVAVNGLLYAFLRHPNFKIHLLLTLLVFLLSWILKITRIEFLLILIAVLLGFTVEFLNTAVEAVCDLITTQWHKDIKIAKDVAAAMMLVVSLGAAAIALIIFIPYLL